MISPMLCETADKPFNSEAWEAQRKLDGNRCLAILNGSTKLQGRHSPDITFQFPELTHLHTLTDKPCILDGEIVAKSGKFEDLQERNNKQNRFDIKIASKAYPAEYHVFDILYYGNCSLIKLPLRERKEFLKTYHGTNVKSFADGVGLFDMVRAKGGEGIVIKRLDSQYEIGVRSPNWLKVKAYKEDIFWIAGVTKGEGSRSATFGSLVLVNDKGEYVGNAGSFLGYSQSWLGKLFTTLETLKSERSIPNVEDDVLFWTKPVKCEIRYLSYCENGDHKLRFPTFRRLVN